MNQFYFLSLARPVSYNKNQLFFIQTLKYININTEKGKTFTIFAVIKIIYV